MKSKEIGKQLFPRHYRELVAMVIFLLHDEEDSKDAVQEVFIRLLGNGTKLVEEDALFGADEVQITTESRMYRYHGTRDYGAWSSRPAGKSKGHPIQVCAIHLCCLLESCIMRRRVTK